MPIDPLADNSRHVVAFDGVYTSVGAGETAKLWYLDNNTAGPDMNIAPVWDDYRGTGVHVAVFDSMPYMRHPDLSATYNSTLDFDLTGRTTELVYPYGTYNSHGTQVAGVIAAADNEVGSVGVAFGAQLSSLAFNYQSATILEDITLGMAKAGAFDVVNCSWSFTTPYVDTAYADLLADPAGSGRGGLGTIMVYSASNSGSTKTSVSGALQGSPFAIAVGAVDRNGDAASFTAVGPNVLVSAGGVEVYTTSSTKTWGLANGTSFSAPAVSGVAALMLEANGALGYRDVQQILALSARMDALDDDGPNAGGTLVNHADMLNGGGMHFNDAFGYGFVDALAAVRLAETWTEQQTLANRLETSASVAFGGMGKLLGHGVTELHAAVTLADSFDAEHVQLLLDTTGWDGETDIDIYLTSPDGTRVRVVYDLSGTEAKGDLDLFPFTSVATMGEDVAGTWTVDIYDRTPSNVGTAYLKGVTVRAFGHADDAADTYVYNDEFAAAAGARGALADTDGGVDTINAAMVTSGSTIDLAAGTGVIDGRALTIAGIENVFGGDGNDTLAGSAAANDLDAGRGNDVLVWSAGLDTLDGGRGTDALTIARSSALIDSVTEADGLLTLVIDGVKSLIGAVETFTFSDRTMTREALLGFPPSEPEEPPVGGEPTTTYGSEGKDRLTGDAGVQSFDGRGGDDRIVGGVGADYLRGGDGVDTIYLGEMTRTRDGCRDTVRIDTSDGRDVVYGFSQADGDRIELMNGGEAEMVHTSGGNTILTYGGTTVTFYDVLI